MIRLSEKTGQPEFTMFLNEQEQAEANIELRNLSSDNYFFDGGYSDAERKILCIHSEWDSTETIKLPLSCIEFKYRSADKLSHRDFLGSLMALNIKRETIGDICVSDGITKIVVTDTVKPLILSEIRKIGSAGVRVSEDDSFDIKVERNFTDISGTVASLRADAVLSTAVNTSREKIIKLIKENGIEINGIKQYSPSADINVGDKFSMRGFGKFILAETGGISKKGRIRITIRKYN